MIIFENGKIYCDDEGKSRTERKKERKKDF